MADAKDNPTKKKGKPNDNPNPTKKGKPKNDNPKRKVNSRSRDHNGMYSSASGNGYIFIWRERKASSLFKIPEEDNEAKDQMMWQIENCLKDKETKRFTLAFPFQSDVYFPSREAKKLHELLSNHPKVSEHYVSADRTELIVKSHDGHHLKCFIPYGHGLFFTPEADTPPVEASNNQSILSSVAGPSHGIDQHFTMGSPPAAPFDERFTDACLTLRRSHANNKLGGRGSLGGSVLAELRAAQQALFGNNNSDNILPPESTTSNKSNISEFTFATLPGDM